MLYLELDRSRFWRGYVVVARCFLQAISDAFGDAANACKSLAEEGHIAQKMFEE